MTTYADIHSRVETILVNASASVLAEIPRLVFDAHRQLEQRFSWRACEGELRFFTVPGSNALALLAPSTAYLRLRDRKTRPYYFDALADVVIYRESDDGTLSYGSTPANDDSILVGIEDLAIPGTLPAFPVGGYIVIGTRLDTSDPSPVLFSKLARRVGVIADRSDSDSGGPWPSGFVSLTVTVDDDGVGESPGIGAASTVAVSGDVVISFGAVSGDARPLEFLEAPDVQRWFGAASQTEQMPTHVSLVGIEEDGTPQANVYPPPDDVYEIRLPCLLSLLASATTVPADTADNWLTNFGFEALAAMAAAEAFDLEEDDARADRWREKAGAEIKRLVALDARARLTTDTLSFSGDVRGPAAPRVPKW